MTLASGIARKLILDIDHFFNDNYGITEAMEWKDMSKLQRKISDEMEITYCQINRLFELVDKHDTLSSAEVEYLPKDRYFECGCLMKYYPFQPPEHLKYIWFAKYYGEFIKSQKCEVHKSI